MNKSWIFLTLICLLCLILVIPNSSQAQRLKVLKYAPKTQTTERSLSIYLHRDVDLWTPSPLYDGDPLLKAKVYLKNGDVYNVHSVIIDPHHPNSFDGERYILDIHDKVWGTLRGVEIGIDLIEVSQIDILSEDSWLITTIDGKKFPLQLLKGTLKYRNLRACSGDFGREVVFLNISLTDTDKICFLCESVVTRSCNFNNYLP